MMMMLIMTMLFLMTILIFMVLLFMATLEIRVKDTTSTCIELQESFAEASNVKAGASSSETELKCRC